MRAARHYWMSTVSRRGAPHTRPVAGMWVDDRLYIGGSPASRWVKNLSEEPRACLNLSEGDESDRAVILHGRVELIRPDRQLATRIVAASNEKYAYGQTVDQYEGETMLQFTPEVVSAWTELANATRFNVKE